MTSRSVADLALALSVLLVCGRLGASLARRLGQAAVVGEIAVGLLLAAIPGKGVGDVGARLHEPGVAMLAQLGAVLLMFEVGLEQRMSDMRRVGLRALAVAIFGVVATLALGLGAATLSMPAATSMQRWFVAASLTATSVGVGAAVLRELGRAGSIEGRLMLGAAVCDDVLGVALLSGMTAFATAESSSRLLVVLGGAMLFLVVALGVGPLVGPRVIRAAARLRAPGAQLGVALSLCFVMSWAADGVGLAPIVGAFAAGLILEPDEALLAELRPLTSLLAPLFFISIGLGTELSALGSGTTWLLALALTIAAIGGKLTCAIPAVGDRWAVAIGMIPRGEVQLLYASIGAGLLQHGRPLVGPHLYAAIVATVLITTLLTPTLLRRRWRHEAVKAGTEAPG